MKQQEQEAMDRLKQSHKTANKLFVTLLTARYEGIKEKMVTESSESTRGQAIELRKLIKLFSN